MAKYVSIGQLQGEIRKSFASLKRYMDESIRAPVVSLAQQAKALADEVVRRADAGEFKGERGERGLPGARGDAAFDFAIGAVTDGETASVTDVGSDGHVVLDFVLQKGEPGEDGAPGQDGQDGAAGKSAYASARDGGYSGTEAQFNADLAGVSGKYSKPSGGIPKTDLASSVRTSLGKADSALQQHQSLTAYRTAAAQDAIDTATRGMTADAYSPGTTYQAGSLVIYGNQLWRCRVTNSDAPSEGASWTATTLAAESALNYQDVTTTTGSSAFEGFYYVDVGVVSDANKARVLSIMPLSVNNNVPTIIHFVTDNQLRVYTHRKDISVTFRIWYRGTGNVI